MHIQVIRYKFNPNNTIGRMLINGKWFAHTLEDVVRNIPPCENKVKEKTAIPYGKYEVIVSFSNRFQKKLPMLLVVPCFEAIRIHGGNTEANTEGCILIGKSLNPDGTEIFNCPGVVADITELISKAEGKVYLEVIQESLTS